jgi:phage/plasmid-like protein (TIGR03299 family)
MHAIEMVRGKASIAYVGEKPWHGLGQPLTKDAKIEVWAKESGLNYPILSTPVKYDIPAANTSSTLETLGLGHVDVETQKFDDRVVLYRGDTRRHLSIVSSKYKVVQPKEVLEFFRDLVAEGGGHMYLETAGVLFEGTRYWAMANTNMEADVIKNDRIRARLLLVSSCDGTLATTAKYIAERVVCNNTLKVAMGEQADAKQQVRVTHGGTFDPAKIKESLGLIDSGWETFMSNIKKMAHKKVTDLDVKNYVAEIMLNKDQMAAYEKDEGEIHARVQTKLDTIFNLYKGAGMGASMVTGTLWGALNAVTEFADHRIGEKDDNKLWNSWFGYTDNLKSKAFELALDMV